MTRMRSREVYCGRCNGKYQILANIDRGTVTSAIEPKNCKHPQQCLDSFKEGVFNHQFDAGAVRVPGGKLGQ